MKITLISLMFLLLFLNSRSNAATDSIGFQVIGGLTMAGELPVPEFEVFQNQQQLINYLYEVSSDTTELTVVPDFSSESSIAIASVYKSRYYKYQKSIGKILTGDTIVVLLHIDSIQLDSTVQPQPAYGIELVSISKTDKPIIAKLESTKVLINRQVTLLNPVVHQSYVLNRIFDIAGRSLTGVSRKITRISVEAANGRGKKTIQIR